MLEGKLIVITEAPDPSAMQPEELDQWAGEVLKVGYDPGANGTDTEDGWHESFVVMLDVGGGKIKIVHVHDGYTIKFKVPEQAPPEPHEPEPPLKCDWHLPEVIAHQKTWTCSRCGYPTHSDKLVRECPGVPHAVVRPELGARLLTEK